MRLMFAAALFANLVGAQDSNWGTWRGPHGTGYVASSHPPRVWGEKKNVRWKVPVDGLGISTPVAWGDRLYLTTAIKTERKSESKLQEAQDRRAEALPTVVYEFVVMALSQEDGAVLWRKTLAETVPHEGGHSTNSQASISPVVDGKNLFVSFGSKGVYCLDHEGDVVWEKQLGLMRTRFQYGEGSSPAVHGDHVVINWDHEGDSFIVALDRKTGKERWRKQRDEVTSWSTPAIVEVDDRMQVIVNATTASRGYDLESGELIWSLAGMTVNCIPSPIVVDGVAYLMSGYRGKMLQAVRLSGAKGDLVDTDHLVWDHKRSTSYVPSAALCGDYLYFLRGMNGVLSCLDRSTGEVMYEGKKLGLRSVYSSPVGAGDLLYITSRQGVTKVIEISRGFKELATNHLDDAVDASMVIVGDVIYLRGRRSLYCIAKAP